MNKYIGIDLNHMTVRSYSAAAKGSRSLVKIEIEVTNPQALGWLLREIAEAQQPAAQPVRQRKAQQLLLPAPGHSHGDAT